MFKITLISHIFVGKGTVKIFIQDLRHEGKIYERLVAMHGLVVPVCLGNIDLARTYYLDIGVRIIHMLFMVWGGECLYEYTLSISSEILEAEKQRSLKELAGSGILHNDLRLANMLWNNENQRVMLIDFERSVVFRSKRNREPSHILHELSPNVKRPRLLEEIPERDTLLPLPCQSA